MKLKHYTFTEREMQVVRDALVEQFIRLRDHMEAMAKRGQQPTDNLVDIVKTLEALKEQFKDDCRKM